VAVDVGEPQLRARVQAFLAGDDPHPLRPSGQVQQAGQLGHSRAGAARLATTFPGSCSREQIWRGARQARSRRALSTADQETLCAFCRFPLNPRLGG